MSESRPREQALESQRTAFVVMARVPDDRAEERPVKTRLADAIGTQSALALYRVVLGETLLTVERASAALGAHRWVAWDRPAPESLAGSEGWRSLVQQGEGLGHRLADVFARLFSRGYERIVILGSDSPALPLSYLMEAASESLDGQVVIGPCLDGGYYLISMSRQMWADWGHAVQRILASVPIGAATTCERTVRGLEQAGLDLKLLGAWVDLDDEADLPLAGRLSAGIARRLHGTSGGAEAVVPEMGAARPADLLSAERGQPLSELGEVYLHLTDRCGGRCLHCYNARGPFTGSCGESRAGPTSARELSLAEWRSLVDEAVSLGASSFVVLGGDPFAKDCLLPLLDHLTGDQSCAVRLFLSRLPRTDPESTVEALAGAGHGRLIPMVSLEGPEAINDVIRGDGSFSESRRLIELLHGVGLRPSVNTVLLRPCLSGLPDLPATLAELGIRRLHLILPHERGRAYQASELIPTGREMLLAFRALQQAAADRGISVDNLSSFRERAAVPRDLCSAGCTLLAVDPYGTVHPCPVTVGDPAFAAGTVRTDALASVWRASPILRLVRGAHALDKRNCRDCDVVSECGGECWVQAHYSAHAAGTRAGFGAPFPYCDFVRPLMQEVRAESGRPRRTAEASPANLTPFDCT